MSKQSISRISYSSLRRDEQHSFNNRVLHILDTTCGACGKPYTDFKAAAEQYGALLHEKGFTPSLSLDEYDRRADEAWRGLDLQISASLKHPKDEVRKAAQTVNNVFEKTTNPTNLNYDQEYGALSVLLTQLSALDPTVLAAAHVEDYVHHLGSCVNDFIEASKKMIDTKSKQQTGAIKTVSQTCYKTWQNLAKYLEVMVIADALPGASDAIDQLNAMNATIKRRLDARKSNKTDDTSVNIVDQTDSSI